MAYYFSVALWQLQSFILSFFESSFTEYNGIIKNQFDREFDFGRFRHIFLKLNKLFRGKDSYWVSESLWKLENSNRHRKLKWNSTSFVKVITNYIAKHTWQLFATLSAFIISREKRDFVNVFDIWICGIEAVTLGTK